MDKILQLREKANKLPLQPGVYIMQDAAGQVIYVGKAKALKNRVTSYFRGEHLPKVAAMVSHVDDFSVIVAGSEFEALMLENSLIKRHQPHYNILLRDDKTYPFLRLDTQLEYPTFSIVGRVQPDGARYFGPYGGRSISRGILSALFKALRLPDCNRKFPRDVGKERPCLNCHMGICDGWCRGTPGRDAYRERIEQAVQLLTGGAKQMIAELETQMLEASEALQFERAAELRDRMLAVKELANQQRVINAACADTDAIGFRRGARTAFVVLHYADGDLAGKDTELMAEPVEEDAAALSALVQQYYARRGSCPRQLLLPVELEDAEPLAQLLAQMSGHRVEISAPQRGAKRELVQAAARNAQEEGQRAESEAERRSKTLQWLQKMLGLEGDIHRIEAFDISNTGDFGIVASMVVFEDGRPAKNKYRRFRMKEVTTQDDFASMHEAVSRRMAHFNAGDDKFIPLPDVLLIDGSTGQIRAAMDAMREQGITGVPVFGMVKDDRHRTRALTDPCGNEIGLVGNPAVFALVGSIQEETHRFAIEYHRTLRKKTIGSQLDEILGVGAKRRAALLKHFKSVKAISQATEEQLCQAVPRSTAKAVYAHFHKDSNTAEEI